MDRASDLTAANVPIGQDFRPDAVLCKIEDLAGFEQSIFEQRTKRDSDLLPFDDFHRPPICLLHCVDSFLRDLDIFFIAFDSDPVASEFLCDRACRPAPEKMDRAPHHRGSMMP